MDKKQAQQNQEHHNWIGALSSQLNLSKSKKQRTIIFQIDSLNKVMFELKGIEKASLDENLNEQKKVPLKQKHNLFRFKTQAGYQYKLKLTESGNELAQLAGIVNMDGLMPKTDQELEQNIVNPNIEASAASHLLNIHREHHLKKRQAMYSKLWIIYQKQNKTFESDDNSKGVDMMSGQYDSSPNQSPVQKFKVSSSKPPASFTSHVGKFVEEKGHYQSHKTLELRPAMRNISHQRDTSMGSLQSMVMNSKISTRANTKHQYSTQSAQRFQNKQAKTLSMLQNVIIKKGHIEEKLIDKQKLIKKKEQKHDNITLKKQKEVKEGIIWKAQKLRERETAVYKHYQLNIKEVNEEMHEAYQNKLEEIKGLLPEEQREKNNSFKFSEQVNQRLKRFNNSVDNLHQHENEQKQLQSQQHKKRITIETNDGGLFAYTGVSNTQSQSALKINARQSSIPKRNQKTDAARSSYDNDSQRGMNMHTYLLDQNVNTQNKKADQLLKKIEEKQQKANQRKFANSMARMHNVKQSNQKFQQFQEIKQSEMMEYEDIDPQHMEVMQRVLDKYDKTKKVLRQREIQKKYDIDVKISQSMEKFKRIQLARKANEQDFEQRIEEVAQKLEHKANKSIARNQELEEYITIKQEKERLKQIDINESRQGMKMQMKNKKLDVIEKSIILSQQRQIKKELIQQHQRSVFKQNKIIQMMKSPRDIVQ